MGRETEVITFVVGDHDRLLERMRQLGEAGNGWINLQPAVEPDDVPPQSNFRLFSAQGPAVPLCTWTPPEPGRRAQYASLGIQHGAGTRGRRALSDRGVDVDPGWRVLTDNPKRGLVIAIPPDADDGRVLTWLLDAGEALCAVPHHGWRATVHLPR